MSWDKDCGIVKTAFSTVYLHKRKNQLHCKVVRGRLRGFFCVFLNVCLVGLFFGGRGVVAGRFRFKQAKCCIFRVKDTVMFMGLGKAGILSRSISFL